MIAPMLLVVQLNKRFGDRHAVNDDDIALYTDESRSQIAMTWYGLRQQAAKEEIDDVTSEPLLGRLCGATRSCYKQYSF